MIIANIVGGLGNQMFQYAAGRALAQRHKVPLKLDIHHFKYHRPRTYSLDCFTLPARFASQLEIARRDWSATVGAVHFAYRLWKRFFPYRAPSAFVEQGLYDPSFRQAPDDVYLHGYFQSEEYFGDIAPALRTDFTLRLPLTARSASIANRIASTQSVSIHIRRGDYVSNPVIRQLYGDICTPDYYRRCVSAIVSQVNAPQFFIFSDDHQWAAQHFRLEYPFTLVSNNAPPYEDLRLMSLCLYNILANSSFSWWAAWLNPNPGKIVIAPRRWYNDPGKDTSHLLPESWIKL